MSDNAALVLIICVLAMTGGAALFGAIRGAVEIVRIIKAKTEDRGPRLRG